VHGVAHGGAVGHEVIVNKQFLSMCGYL